MWLARRSATAPEWNEATIARMPMFSITIAMSSSIRPKPSSERSARENSRLPNRHRGGNPSSAMRHPADKSRAWPPSPTRRSTPRASSSRARSTRPTSPPRASSCASAACSRSKLGELPASGDDGVRSVFKTIKPKSLQIFSRQFATMIEAGLNVVGALVILEEQTDDEYLAAVVGELRADVEGGLLLSQAMARHPKVFSRLYVSMVEAGEAAGILDIVLDRVAFQIEKETKIKRRVKGAMIYPTMVFVFATLVLIAMLLFLVPIFAKIFEQLGGQLPKLTQIVVGVSNLLQNEWYIVFPRHRLDLRLLPLEEDRERAASSGTGSSSRCR